MTLLAHIFVIAWLLGWTWTACPLLEAERDLGLRRWDAQVPGLIMLFFVWPFLANIDSIGLKPGR